MKKSTVIVADSSANLLTNEQNGFKSVAMKIIAGEKEYVDDEKLDVNGMVADLAQFKGRTSTACPGVGEWTEAFGDADAAFGVSITSHLSGCYNAGSVAAAQYEQENPGKRAFVLDTLSTGPEMELCIEKIRELTQTDFDFDSVVKELKQYHAKTHLLFALKSLANLARNGRVSPTVAKAASLLGIRIIGKASSEGELEPLHKCPGENRTVRKMWESMKELGFAGGKVRITHLGNETAAEQIAAAIREHFPKCDIRIGENRGLCAYYAESGGVLVGFEGN